MEKKIINQSFQWWGIVFFFTSYKPIGLIDRKILANSTRLNWDITRQKLNPGDIEHSGARVEMPIYCKIRLLPVSGEGISGQKKLGCHNGWQEVKIIFSNNLKWIQPSLDISISKGTTEDWASFPGEHGNPHI